MSLCHYGCNQEAKFQITSKKYWCCSDSYNKCPENKRKNSEGNKKRIKETEYVAWNKGLHVMTGWQNKTEKEIEAYHKKSGKTLNYLYSTNQLVPPFQNKFHTLESKQKMSNSRIENHNNGIVKTKYYEVYSKVQNKLVKVQGTWEFEYAKYLNEIGINWIRNGLKLQYKLNENDYFHTYYPDFYLPDYDTYIEIKGYMWKSDDGRVDDQRKMNAIFECNPNTKIVMFRNKKDWINYKY